MDPALMDEEVDAVARRCRRADLAEHAQRTLGVTARERDAAQRHATAPRLADPPGGPAGRVSVVGPQRELYLERCREVEQWRVRRETGDLGGGPEALPGVAQPLFG